MKDGLQIKLIRREDCTKNQADISDFCVRIYTNFCDGIKENNHREYATRVILLQMIIVDLYANLGKEDLIKILGEILKNADEQLKEIILKQSPNFNP